MTDPTTSKDALPLPAWAQVTEKRQRHIRRVVALLGQWSTTMSLPPHEAAAWRDAGVLHDALRDADEQELRQITGDTARPAGMLHGFAAAIRLEREGEARAEVLEAIRWHTIGHAGWGQTGRALYMADFLEPGRSFMPADRAFLARLVPQAFDDVFRQVVRMRIEWAVRDGKGLAPETVALWDIVR
jgi:HD superfamily phosphohydrolase YqeK